MSIESALYDHLTDDVGVSAIVGAQVYQEIAPASATRPHLIQNLIDEQRNYHLGGESAIRVARVQIDARADDSPDRRALHEAVCTALSAFSGLMGDGNLDVRSCHLDSADSSYEPPRDGSQAGSYRSRMDFMIWYNP